MSRGGEGRVWPGRLPYSLDGLRLWTAPGAGGSGEPCRKVLGGVPYALASTSASGDAADAPGGATPSAALPRGELLARVPGGHGLVVDAATAGARRLTPGQVNGLRGELPHGDEPYASFAPPPAHLLPLVADARKQAKAAGARRLDAAWVRLPNGPAGLLLAAPGQAPGQKLDGALDGALDRVLDAVRRHAPQERVRVTAATPAMSARMRAGATAARPGLSPLRVVLLTFLAFLVLALALGVFYAVRGVRAG